MIKSINIKNSIICVIIIFIFIIIKSLDASTSNPNLGLDASTRNPKVGVEAPTPKLGHPATPTPKLGWTHPRPTPSWGWTRARLDPSWTWTHPCPTPRWVWTSPRPLQVGFDTFMPNLGHQATPTPKLGLNASAPNHLC